MLMRQLTDPIARILIAAIFVAGGATKLMHIATTQSQIAGAGIPMPQVATWVAVAIELLGGICLILGFHTRIVAWIMFLYLIPVTLTFHNFWVASGAARQMQQANFMKNLAIMGALLLLAGRGAGRSAVHST
jgi:putative oxidoreductase